MTPLQEKLTDIIHKASRAYNGAEVTALVAETEQAFKDAGWLRTIDISIPASTNYDRPELLTGQEWFNRFEKVLWVPPKQEPIRQGDDGESHDRFFRAGGQQFMYTQALLGAKKASGLA